MYRTNLTLIYVPYAIYFANYIVLHRHTYIYIYIYPMENIQYKIKNQTVSENRVTLFVCMRLLVLLLAFAVLTVGNTKNDFYKILHFYC